MTRASDEKRAAAVAYHGEIWTDGRGLALVVLPVEARSLEPPLVYALEPTEPLVSATVTAEFEDGQFAIKTNEPHVEVAWRAADRRPGARTERPIRKE
jgi:hypothetical protein